jgi:hypothetical protein
MVETMKARVHAERRCLKLAYGQKNDAYLGWDDSLASLEVLSQAVGQRPTLNS